MGGFPGSKAVMNLFRNVIFAISIGGAFTNCQVRRALHSPGGLANSEQQIVSNDKASMIEKLLQRFKAAGATVEEGDGTIKVTPAPIYKALPPREVSSKATIEENLRTERFSSVSFEGATIEEAIDFVRTSHGCDDPEPWRFRGFNIVLKSSAITDSKTITLDLRDVPKGEALRYIASLAGMEITIEPFAVVISPKGEKRSSKFERSDAPAARLIIPHLSFAGATLVEALDYLRLKANELDPQKKGVNIVLNAGLNTSTITLDLREVPVSEALRYTAELANVRLERHENSYEIKPLK